MYLNNQQVVASKLLCRIVLNYFCYYEFHPDIPDNTEDNSIASDQTEAQPPAGLSAEDVQRITTAVAALVGGPSTSNNPWHPAHHKSLPHLPQVRN